IVASCGECFYCLRDLPQKCQRSVKYGHQQWSDDSVWNGGLADYCLLAANTSIFRVPDELPDAVACPANCATATVAAAIEATGTLTDRAVLVMGAGMLGLTACAMARDRGATRVICCDLNAERLTQAVLFGATHTTTPDNVVNTCAELTAGFGVDACLELTGATPAIQTALASLRMGGVLVEVGAVFPTPALELQPEQLVRRQWTLRGIHNYAPRHLQQAITFLAAHSQLPFGALVAQWFSLADADQAFRAAGSGKCFRVGVRP
ncbi:MAG TPA: zinc-binding dehydrogenase, partial [Pirellulaceae bacterium]|nr:zinc-binding dehydrogenase [Pirellulaceae bacterium]